MNAGMTSMTYDLLIVGGGINGAAIAREAALNGWSVLLVEKGDLAGATSSASTKLIHGGLRYLEYYDFKLVAEALRERERLVKAAPHVIHPLRFVLPHENAVRPWWMVGLGLYLYDFLGGRTTLARSRSLRKNDTPFTAPLKGGRRGFVYSDAFVDDSRLTVLNALDAADNGADIRVGTALETAPARRRRLANDPVRRQRHHRTVDGQRGGTMGRGGARPAGGQFGSRGAAGQGQPYRRAETV